MKGRGPSDIIAVTERLRIEVIEQDKEIKRLKELNREMMEALQKRCAYCGGYIGNKCGNCYIKPVLAKAGEGE